MNTTGIAWTLLDRLKARGFEVVIRNRGDEWEVRIDRGTVGFHVWGQLPEVIFKACKHVELVYD